jgi:hypothetical protein
VDLARAAPEMLSTPCFFRIGYASLTVSTLNSELEREWVMIVGRRNFVEGRKEVVNVATEKFFVDDFLVVRVGHINDTYTT